MKYLVAVIAVSLSGIATAATTEKNPSLTNENQASAQDAVLKDEFHQGIFGGNPGFGCIKIIINGQIFSTCASPS